MTKVTIKPATQEHASLIEKQLRPDAVKEIEMIGPNTREAIKYALILSRHAWSGFANDNIACMVGVQPSSFISRMASLWLISTPEVEKHSFLFLRWSRRFIEELIKQDEYTTIHGQVREDFHRSVLWIKWLGFKIEPPSQGVRYFHWEKKSS